MLELLQGYESLDVHYAARKQSSIFTCFNRKEIPVTVKISIYFLSTVLRLTKIYPTLYRRQEF